MRGTIEVLAVVVVVFAPRILFDTICGPPEEEEEEEEKENEVAVLDGRRSLIEALGTKDEEEEDADDEIELFRAALARATAAAAMAAGLW